MSDISSEMRRIVDMVVKNERGIPYVLRLEYVTSLGDMRDEDDTSGECYVLVARPGNGGEVLSVPFMLTFFKFRYFQIIFIIEFVF